MSGLAVTPSHLKAVVRKLLAKAPAARAIGVASERPWSGPAEVIVGDQTFSVTWCPSVLALREELLRLETEGTRLVLITNQSEASIGTDALARMTGAQLYATDAWKTVKDLFGARRADARLAAYPWMAEMLIELAPPAGYPEAASGFLDMDRAWGPILTRLGFGSSRPDPRAVLEWSTVSSHLAFFHGLADAVRADVTGRVEECAGALGALMVHAAAIGQEGDVLALGLVLQVVFPAGDGAMTDAAVRLERLLGGRGIAPELARSWTAMVEEHLLRQDLPADRRTALAERAAALLDELKAKDAVHLSPWLPAGLAKRCSRLAAALGEVLEGRRSGGSRTVEEATRSLIEHRLLAPEGERVVRMVERVARRLGAPAEPARTPALAELAREYASDGAYLDWARRVIACWAAPVLDGATLRALHDRLLARREDENQRFARALAEAGGAGDPASGVPGVEELLDRVVAPLAALRPVLVIVMDGISAGVMRELVSSLARTTWVELAPAPAGAGPRRPLVGLAAFPTVTEVSRTSLLCGRLTRGGQSEEKAGFRDHAGLKAHTGARHPPVLFHKAELTDGTGHLAAAVTACLLDPQQKVVGAVVNAVDDHLTKGEQLAVRWDLESIPLLARLLETAQRAGRVVVITSDHGHVLERETVHRPDDSGGDRWRKSIAAPGELEVRLTGPRVLAGDGKGIVVPWSETIRYTSKKAGYHGGVSLAEAVVPVVVLNSAPEPPPGWVELPDGAPAWWLPAAAEVSAPAPVPVPVRPPATKAPNLFNYAEAPAGEPAASWIDRLLTCDRFREQQKLAARAAVPDDRVRKVLAALEERGGRLTTSALARALDLPAIRLTGVLASMRRVLNVDGYNVMTLDDDDVVLNRGLLITQFELEGKDA